MLATNSTPTVILGWPFCRRRASQTTRAGGLERGVAGGEHGAAVGEGFAGFTEADVDVDDVSGADGHGGGELDAQAGGGDVAGLAGEVAGAGGFKELHGAALADAEAAAALFGDGFGA